MTPELLIHHVHRAVLPVEISDSTDSIKRDGQRRAAVLFPLVDRGQGWHVILTQRPETMPSHPGQIAFPGGKCELNETASDAALRETEEEIGVSPIDVKLIGRLPSFDAVSDFRVTPFVGIVSPTAAILPDPHEVADVFEVPMTFLMNPQNHIRRDVFFDERTHVLYDMPYDGTDGVHRNIWGMTAMTIYRMWQRGFEDLDATC